MISSILDLKQPFFIGIAGSGMSAIAQYLREIGMDVSGSDRFFSPGVLNETRQKLEEAGIRCYEQNGEGINSFTDLVVVSAAIEDTVGEVKKAKELGIPIIKRSELLALIAKSKRTIAVGGTSGKSTTSAMIYEIMEQAGMEPGIISGAGLISIMKEGKIGNAKLGKGDWLVIEADESDGSIVQYEAEIGVLLNIDKDHQEIEELMRIFGIFKNNSRHFIVNASHELASSLSQSPENDFGTDEKASAKYLASGFQQNALKISFSIGGTSFSLDIPGKHNMENAVAAVASVNSIGVSLPDAARALANYQGIYRRVQVYGEKNGIILIDDFAHNPVKCAAAIRACQPVAPKLIAWFQPHGYKPTKFLKEEFVKEISQALRPEDEIWMSEIFYAGGTATKDISANDLIEAIRKTGKKAYFVEDRKNLLEMLRPHFTEHCVLLLMGARDPSLEGFAKEVWEGL
ncbi:MAG: UDP-N-acetylmuramate--alanine ligase [Chitinophagaceae bacterium]|nr:UDP-N-acetylmuramate--alanine ligase [Chitinophagaceae bacterium]